jgi:hypothetical protein
MRERERERGENVGGGGLVVVRDTTMAGGGQGNNICGFEGSQGVPANPSGRLEVCINSILIY